MNNVVEWLIRARDLTAAPFRSFWDRLTRTRKEVDDTDKETKKSFRSQAGEILKLVGAYKAITFAAGLVKSAVTQAFAFERAEQQFKILLGSADAAKAKLKELADFSAATPFEFKDITTAERQLIVFTDGVLKGAKALTLIGDAAAATNNSIQDVSFWVGRAFSAIQAGRPFGEAAMRLQEMGILSGTARNKLDDLSEAGASSVEVWHALRDSLGKYEGGMKNLATTGDGLFSTLKDNWSLALGDFGKEFLDLSKGSMQALIDKLAELRDSGTIQEWASNAVAALRTVMDYGREAVALWRSTQERLERSAAYWGGFSVGGRRGGEQAEAEVTRRQIAEEMADNRERRRRLNAARAERAASPEGLTKKEAEAKAKVQGDALAEVDKALAVGQKDLDAKRLAEQAKKAQEALKKEAEKRAEIFADAERKVAEIREQMIRREYDKRIEGLRKEVDTRADLEGKALSRLSDAQRREAEAFAEYLDPELFKRRRGEEKAKGDAEATFAKESEALSRMLAALGPLRVKLNDHEQAVFNLMKAREGVNAETAAARETAANTRAIRDKLDKALAAAP